MQANVLLGGGFVVTPWPIWVVSLTRWLTLRLLLLRRRLAAASPGVGSELAMASATGNGVWWTSPMEADQPSGAGATTRPTPAR